MKISALKTKKAILGVLLISLTACVYFYNSLKNETRRNYHQVASSNRDGVPIPFRPLDTKLVIYNRVTKCASSTMIWLAKKQSKARNFRLINEHYQNMSKYFNMSTRKFYASKLASLQSNTLFIRHLYFFDLSKYALTSPAYINVIRDPVDRFISRYYFARFGFMWKKNRASNDKIAISMERRNRTLDDCILGGVEKCLRIENYMSLMTFFCDYDEPSCRSLTRRTLERAKTNVIRHYAVVGLQEDLNNTLAILEAILPTYFGGAKSLLPSCPETKRTKARNRIEPSAKAKAVLREALRYDVEFYEFVKKRFYKQLENLKELHLISNDEDDDDDVDDDDDAT